MHRRLPLRDGQTQRLCTAPPRLSKTGSARRWPPSTNGMEKNAAGFSGPGESTRHERGMGRRRDDDEQTNGTGMHRN